MSSITSNSPNHNLEMSSDQDNDDFIKLMEYPNPYDKLQYDPSKDNTKN